jgi:hypothetical protein
MLPLIHLPTATAVEAVPPIELTPPETQIIDRGQDYAVYQKITVLNDATGKPNFQTNRKWLRKPFGSIT